MAISSPRAEHVGLVVFQTNIALDHAAVTATTAALVAAAAAQLARPDPVLAHPLETPILVAQRAGKSYADNTGRMVSSPFIQIRHV